MKAPIIILHKRKRIYWVRFSNIATNFCHCLPSIVSWRSTLDKNQNLDKVSKLGACTLNRVGLRDQLKTIASREHSTLHGHSEVTVFFCFFFISGYWQIAKSHFCGLLDCIEFLLATCGTPHIAWIHNAMNQAFFEEDRVLWLYVNTHQVSTSNGRSIAHAALHITIMPIRICWKWL